MKELCIRCNKPTPYDINYPITQRHYYIDGSGQLCQSCYEVLYVRGKGHTGEVEKGEMEKIEKDGLERLKAAREEQPLHLFKPSSERGNDLPLSAFLFQD